MTKRIFHSIFLVALAVLFASLLLILGFLYGYFASLQKNQLKAQTLLAAQGVSHEGLGYFDGLDSDGFRLTTTYADHCLVVSTPDPASLRDAERVAELLLLSGKENIHLIVNRITPKLFPKMELTVDDIMDDVGLPLLGIVPEDHRVVLAANDGEALIFAETKGAAEACLRMSRRLCGIPTGLMKF